MRMRVRTADVRTVGGLAVGIERKHGTAHRVDALDTWVGGTLVGAERDVGNISFWKLDISALRVHKHSQ